MNLGLLGSDIPDHRDRLKKVRMGFLAQPKPIDLCDHFDIAIDHQRDNSCTGRSARKLAEVCFQKTMPEERGMRFSALGYYYEARPRLGVDQGAQLRSVALALKNKGGVPESAWGPNADPTRIPDDYEHWDPNRTYKLPSVERVVNAQTLMRVLSIEKVPVITGIAIQDRATKQLVDSGWSLDYDPSDPVAGYHAETAVGWDVVRGRTWIKWAGSWGVHVGISGFYWRPLDYVSEGAVVDMWTVGRDFF